MACVKSVSQVGCVSQDLDALVSQGTKEFRVNPIQKVLNAIQRVRFTKSTVRLASIRDKEGPSLGKIQVKPRHQRSPYALKFQDRSHEETERQERCAQKQGLGSCRKHIQAQSEKTRLHSTFPRRNGYSRLRQQKSRRGESQWLIPGRVCIWSVRKTSTLLSWRPWAHQGFRRRWWRPTARCEQIKKRRYMSNNWAYSSLLCFFKKLPQCFQWRNSAKNMGTRIIGTAVKIHISSKVARELIARYQTRSAPRTRSRQMTWMRSSNSYGWKTFLQICARETHCLAHVLLTICADSPLGNDYPRSTTQGYGASHALCWGSQTSSEGQYWSRTLEAAMMLESIQEFAYSSSGIALESDTILAEIRALVNNKVTMADGPTPMDVDQMNVDYTKYSQRSSPTTIRSSTS